MRLVNSFREKVIAIITVVLCLLSLQVANLQAETTKDKRKLSPQETFKLFKYTLETYPYFKRVTFDYQNRAQCEVNLPLLEVDMSKQMRQSVTINAYSCTLIIENDRIIINIRGNNGSKSIPVAKESKGAQMIVDSLIKRDTRLGALIALLAG
jgi:hypothetical protein